MPFTLDLTDRVRVTPFAPFVLVGVAERAGERFAAPGVEGLRAEASRAGLPGGAGFLAVVDMLWLCLSAVVLVEC